MKNNGILIIFIWIFAFMILISQNVKAETMDDEIIIPNIRFEELTPAELEYGEINKPDPDQTPISDITPDPLAPTPTKIKTPTEVSDLSKTKTLNTPPSPNNTNDTQTDCNCDQYKDFVGFSTLADRVATVGLKYSREESNSLFNDQLEDEYFKLRFKAKDVIPEHCRKKLLDEMRTKISVKIYGNFFNAPKRLVPGIAADRSLNLLEKYYIFLREASDVACMEKTEASMNLMPGGDYNEWLGKQRDYRRCLENLNSNQNYLDLTDEFLIKDRSIDDVNSSFQNNYTAFVSSGANQYGYLDLNAQEYKVLKYYNQILNSKSEADVLRKIKGFKSKLTTAELLDIVALYGVQTTIGYDVVREQTSEHKNSVKGDEILDAAQKNTYLVLGGSPFVTPAMAGICSDIAVTMARMIKAGGLKKTYVLGYATLNKGTSAGHSVVIAQDPDNPNQLYKINYGSKFNIQGGSTGALLTGNDDTGFGYTIFDPESGRPIAYKPGVATVILSKFAGASPQDIGGDPLYASNEALIGAGFKLGEKRNHGIGFGYARDEFGNHIVAAGYHLKFGNENYAPGKIGGAIAYQNRPNEIYNFEGGKDLNLALATVYVNQGVKTPVGKVGGQDIWGDASVGANFIYASGDGMIGKLGAIHGKLGINTERVWSTGRVKLRAETQHSINDSDVRIHYNNLQSKAITVDYYALRLDASFNLPYFEKLYLVSMLDYVGNTELGHRGRAEVGVASKHGLFTVAGEGALTEDTVRFQDGVNRKISSNIVLPFWNDRITLKVNPYIEEVRGTHRLPLSADFSEDPSYYSNDEAGKRRMVPGAFLGLELVY